MSPPLPFGESSHPVTTATSTVIIYRECSVLCESTGAVIRFENKGSGLQEHILLHLKACQEPSLR